MNLAYPGAGNTLSLFLIKDPIQWDLPASDAPKSRALKFFGTLATSGERSATSITERVDGQVQRLFTSRLW